MYIYKIFINFIKCLCILRYTIRYNTQNLNNLNVYLKCLYTLWYTIRYNTRYKKIKNRFTIRFRFWKLWPAFQSYFIGNIFARVKRCIFINYHLILSLLNLREYGYFWTKEMFMSNRRNSLNSSIDEF